MALTVRRLPLLGHVFGKSYLCSVPGDTEEVHDEVEVLELPLLVKVSVVL